MKYWKQGFYDEPIEGSVEITDEYWQSLLDGQSDGKEIVEDVNGRPILQEHIFTLEEVKEHTLYNIQRYDKSEYVNSFLLNGDSIWLSKDLRTSIMNAVAIKKSRNIKTSSKKISEWVSELLVNHKEVVEDDYKAYCKEVIEQELDLFRNVFKSKNGLLDN